MKNSLLSFPYAVPLTVLLLLALPPYGLTQTTKKINGQSAIDYLLSCQKQNGAFGPFDKAYTDLAWTYPAIHALTLLNAEIPRKEAAFVNGNQSWMEKQPWKNGPWYWSFYQKAKLFDLCGGEGEVEDGVRYGQQWELNYKPRRRYTEFRNYVKGEFFDMSSLSHMVVAIRLLKGTIANPDVVKGYVLKRQTPEGAFTDDVAESFVPLSRNAHLIATHDAVMALRALGDKVPDAQDCIAWLQSCQTASGGFRWSPTADDHSNKADVWYTWAAVTALDALGARPRDVDACVAWLNSLQNVDGGFGDRPGWNSRIYSSYYVVHALDILTEDARAAISRKSLKSHNKEIPEGVYSIFQAHHKSPAGATGMVDSVVAMNLNLVAVKSREKDVDPAEGISTMVKEARSYAERKGYPVEILESPENYSHKLHWMNGQQADHVSNFIIPPALTEEEASRYAAAFAAGQQGLNWKQFKEEVIMPIRSLRSGNLFYPELDYTMINAYMVYDDGVDGGPGYNAVPAAHFGNIDWIRHFPYKEKWEGILPFIADGDAHDDIVGWRENLLQYRNVFIAKGFRYDDYIDASVNGRSVCVIHMPDGEVRYYGTKEAIAYLKKHRSEWQWWQEKD